MATRRGAGFTHTTGAESRGEFFCRIPKLAMAESVGLERIQVGAIGRPDITPLETSPRAHTSRTLDAPPPISPAMASIRSRPALGNFSLHTSSNGILRDV